MSKVSNPNRNRSFSRNGDLGPPSRTESRELAFSFATLQQTHSSCAAGPNKVATPRSSIDKAKSKIFNAPPERLAGAHSEPLHIKTDSVFSNETKRQMAAFEDFEKPDFVVRLLLPSFCGKG